MFAFAILMISLVSAETTFPGGFTQPVNKIYNLGDTVYVPMTIKTLTRVFENLDINLICNGTETNFHRQGINLVSGGEIAVEASLLLMKSKIGVSTGTCIIKAVLGADYILTDEFRISDVLTLEASSDKTEYNPRETVSISGKATKENAEGADGFVEAEISMPVTNFSTSNYTIQNITQLGTMAEGIFSMSFVVPSDMKAGTYFANVKGYEKDANGDITNQGNNGFTFVVKQFPTNLELILENTEIEPRTTFKLTPVLHDQTGESMSAIVFITLKDTTDKIYEQKEINTNEAFEYFVKANEAPAEWKAFAVSSQLTSESRFRIKEKEKIDVQIVNKTIQITNTGNVPYNKTLLVKIGDNPLNLDISLNVGQSKKYILSAPNGEYKVEVVSTSGEQFSQMTSLTGRAIDIREASGGILSLAEHPVLWVFVFLILGFVTLTIFKRVRKKPFFGFGNPLSVFKKKDYGKREMIFNRSSSVTNTGSKAELSLSIRGEKQDASVVCVRIRNLREVRSKRGSASDAIQRITDAAEESKAVTYENQDFLFFILAPVKTKTYQNEKTALEIAENTRNILTEHNKMFNQKIDFGVSVNQGAIVAKFEGGVLQFMSMGTLITALKRIAALSKGEVLLSEKMNDLVRVNVKTEKRIREGTPVFVIKGIKKENEEHKKFIRNFVDRMEKEKRER